MSPATPTAAEPLGRQPRPRRIALNLMAIEHLAGGSFDGVLEAARIADRLGVHRVVLPDHVVMSAHAHRERDGFPYPLSASWLEPLTALAAVAAVTERVRLGTNVLIAPLRPAALLAKQLATLDAISGGRVEVALGVGWQQAEYAATGATFEGRTSALVELVGACRALWGGAPAAAHPVLAGIGDLHAQPLPPQGDRLPLSFGVGLGPRNVARIAELGVGWAPAPMPVEDFAAGVARLRAACVEAGRDPAPLPVTGAVTLLPQEVRAVDAGVPHPLAEVEALWDAGADTVIVHPLAHCDGLEDLPGFLSPLLAAAG
ncbi:TIGR03619 family F420-dependent LLM class oxidoreductase [Nocardioides ochotonae]|uniref:TIGR03619 family F420-dependent LLM class oxidoreductase n=1 Tax=Nocardioides ochotonae TaxID=2685869 RepID=UPI00140DC888|nr:TIGR03619 family F420-dependent LLM class oxidoreductase [Nocardioides ochotonae]